MDLFSKFQAEGRKMRKKTKSGGKKVSRDKNFVKYLSCSQVENVVVFQQIPGRLSKYFFVPLALLGHMTYGRCQMTSKIEPLLHMNIDQM